MKRNVNRLVVAVCLLLGLFVLLGSGSVHAATNQGPNPDDFSESNTYGNDWSGFPRRIDYVVATTSNNYIPTTRVKLFLPSPNGTITIHNHNICYATFRNGGDNFDLPDNGNRNGSSGNSVSYTIGSQTRWGAWDGSNTCDSKTTTINVSGAALDTNTGMYLYVLNAQALPANAPYMQTFWITAPAGTIISQDSTLSATSGFGMNQANPITRGNNPPVPNPPSPYRNYSDWNIKFAPDCSVTSPTVTRTIEMYDDDNRAFSAGDNYAVQPRRFSVGVRELNRSDVVQGMLTPGISFPDGSGGSANVGGGFYQVWTSGSNKRIHLQFTFKRDMKYQFILRDVYQDNTLQFKIPFDNVYYYQPCQTGNFNLQPGVNIQVTDPSGAAVPDNVAEPGDTITFKYNVNNSGTTGSTPVSCTVYGRTFAGYNMVLNPPDSSSDPGFVPPILGCPPTFPPGSTLLTDEVRLTTAADASKTICRTLSVNPATPGGGAAATKNCAIVATKPYTRVFGGDVSVGGGHPTAPIACAASPMGAVIGWNKGSGGGYGGAGVQFAALALGVIFEAASSSSGTSMAAEPSGLAFGNTSPSGSVYGGEFGALPCMTDYFAAKPTTPLPFTTIPAATTSGSYSPSGLGPFTMSGALAAGKRVTVYAEGDVFIDNNITYPASWSANDPPLFQLVAKGNIFIKNNVSRLDGVYIAQMNGASGGTIYTCATSAAPLVPSGSLHTTCSTGLTVNGAFMANEVQLLRTRGTRQQALADEPNTSNNIAEIFNYSPAMWMAQPLNSSSSSIHYDSITSLPPIL